MGTLKCITFDKSAQDSLPQHIKDKMKADRDRVRNEKKQNEIVILTVENAPTVSTVSDIQNPEWGTFRFRFNEQQLPGNMHCSTVGSGSHSKVIFESEYKFWKVESFK
jgi:hypothetical protein